MVNEGSIEQKQTQENFQVKDGRMIFEMNTKSEKSEAPHLGQLLDDEHSVKEGGMGSAVLLGHLDAHQTVLERA